LQISVFREEAISRQHVRTRNSGRELRITSGLRVIQALSEK
jgi:hypothetical protein